MDHIETPRLILRPFEDADFEAVHEWAGNPDVTRYQTWGPNTEEETRAFIKRSREVLNAPEPHDVHLAIVERSEKSLVGGCGLMPRRAEYREFEIEYSLNPRYWRQGIGYEAIASFLDYAFRRVGAHRVFACIDPMNHASISLAEKLGLRREGHLLRDVRIDGEWRDTLIYAALEDEFEGSPPSMRGLLSSSKTGRGERRRKRA